MKRFSVSLLLAFVLTALAVAPVFGGSGHIYGVVFMDDPANQNGKWDNEAGVSNVTVHFKNGDSHIELKTSWNDNLLSSASQGDSEFDPDNYCSHLDEEHRNVPKGCNGTVGLIPVAGWWKVWIDLPANTSLSKGTMCGNSEANACDVEALGIGDEGWFEIGIIEGGGGYAAQPGIRIYKANKPTSVKLFSKSAKTMGPKY